MRADKVFISLVVAIFLAVYTGIVFGFLSLEGEIRTVWLFVLAAPLVAILLTFPKAAFIVLAIQVFLVRTLYDYNILPREATWLTDVLIAIVVGRMLFLLPWRKDRVRKLEWFLAAMVGFAVLSTILNGNSLTTFAAGLRLGFRYVFLFLAAVYLDVSPTWIRRYAFFLIGIALLQAPITIYQFSVFRWKDPDLITGTFGRGQTGLLALFLLCTAAYLIARILERGRVPLRYLFVIAIMSIPPVLGSGRIYFLFLPLLVLFMIRAEFLRRPLVTLLIATTSIAVFVGADFLVTATGGAKAGESTTYRFMKRLPRVFGHEIAVAQAGGFGRTDRYMAAMNLMARTPKNIVVGEGPGAITGLVVAEHHSSKARFYARWGLSSISAMSVPWLLVEYGYLGLALFLGLLWLIYRRAKYLRNSDDMQMRVFGRLLEALTLVYAVGTLYSSVWQMDSASTLFWPLAGMFVQLSYREQSRQVVAADTATIPSPAPARASA